MLAPLLESDDESSVDSEDSDASTQVETVKKTPVEKAKTLAVYVGLGGGVVASIGAMVLAPAIAIFLMGGLCIANVPYSAYKEKKIDSIPSLRSMNSKLKEAASDLSHQIDTLSCEIDALEPEADRAAAVEEELRGIAEEQDVNVNKLVELVKENGKILAEMKDNVRRRIVQDTIEIVLRSDRDNDNSIDKNEAKTLALRISLALQEYNVVFNIEKFLIAIGNEPTVEKVIALVQKLLPGDKKNDNNSVSDSDEDSDEDSDGEIEMYDIFHMAEDEEGQEGYNPKASMGGESLMRDKRKKSKPLSMLVKNRSRNLSTLEEIDVEDY